jgi:small subunit ribosomal protein S20
VAHSLSAKKRIRQSIKRRARNRVRKDLLKEQTKIFLATLGGTDMAKAEVELRKTVTRLDKIASKHTIHRKTASRRRSRLTLRLNAAKVAAAAAATAPAPTTKVKAKKGT